MTEKQNDSMYNGRALTCNYNKAECSEPTANFSASMFCFSKGPMFCLFPSSIRSQIDKDCFCSQQLLYHKTQCEDDLLRYESGFRTNAGLAINSNSSYNPIWCNRHQVYRRESPWITVDVRNKKIKSTTDGYITKKNRPRYECKSWDTRYTSSFFSKVDYMVIKQYDGITLAEINTLTKLSEQERTQIFSILSLAQTNPHLNGYLLTGEMELLFKLKVQHLNANIICHHYTLPKKNVLTKNPCNRLVYTILYIPHQSKNLFNCHRSSLWW